MNQSIVSNFVAANGFFLPSRRITAGGVAINLTDLEVFGLEVLGEPTQNFYQRCKLPEGWKPVASTESEMQLRLHDDQDRLRAKIFYKPASQGGSASMEVCPRYNVAVKTDETHQWAEVTDGNDVIFETSRALKSERNLNAFNADRQPEHVAATEWLAARRPEHKNALAYWN